MHGRHGIPCWSSAVKLKCFLSFSLSASVKTLRIRTPPNSGAHTFKKLDLSFHGAWKHHPL